MTTGRIKKIALSGWRGMPYLELALDDGPLTAFVGNPGAGKSTAAMLICYALLPDRRFLNIRPLSDVGDVHLAGVDTLAGRIDPLTGYAYVLLDIESTDGQRVVAGIHASLTDGRTVFTPINIQSPERQFALQDFLRVIDGDDEYYPDLSELSTHLAQRGVSLKPCRTIREYGEILFQAGVIPCDYSDQAERALYGKLIESTFRGGISTEVAAQIKGYMLPAATRIPESIERLQKCADTVMRTNSALDAADVQLKLLQATYGLGKAIVAQALAKTSGDEAESIAVAADARAVILTHEATLASVATVLGEIAATGEVATASKALVEKKFSESISDCTQEHLSWKSKEITGAEDLRSARSRLVRFREGAKEWARGAGELSDRFDLGYVREQLKGQSEALIRQQIERNLELEASAVAIAKLEAGLANSSTSDLADALGGQSIAEVLDAVQEDEARALELALGGVVEGVIGADISSLATVADHSDYPHTFWIRSSIPTSEPLHEIGDWYAASLAGGFLVTSRRRKLTLGKQARESEIKRLESLSESLRNEARRLGEQNDKVIARLHRLLEKTELVSEFLAARQNATDFDQAIATAETAYNQVLVKLEAAARRLNELNAARTIDTEKLDLQISNLEEQKRQTELRQKESRDTVDRLTAAARAADVKAAEANQALTEMKRQLSASHSWLKAEADQLPRVSNEEYLTKQSRLLSELGHSLGEELPTRVEWLASVQVDDALSCCSIWQPLREIVSDRISVESLDQDGTNLIESMSSRRRELSAQLQTDRVQMRAEAKSMYAVITTEIRKQSQKISRLSAFGESMCFGNVTGMRISMQERRDWLDHLQRIAQQIDMFTNSSDLPLDQQLSELFQKALNVKMEGMALLDYRSYVDLTIEARRNNRWEAASGLSGGESIGGGLAISLMLARSLALRGTEGKAKSFTPVFVIDEVQRADGEGQGVIVQFGKRYGFQVIVTALSLEASYPCKLHVMTRHSVPEERVVSREVQVVLPAPRTDESLKADA